jgi:hypothetical protein
MNAGSAQQCARRIGTLYVITIVAGGFGESHVPNMLLIANDLAHKEERVEPTRGVESRYEFSIPVESPATLRLRLG